MTQKHAFAAEVEIGDEQHKIGINSVTIVIDPLNSSVSEEGRSWTYTDVRGLPTEDSSKCHELNEEFGDADPEQQDERWYLSKDSGVGYKPEEGVVVIAGMTGFHGHGEAVMTRIPEEAVSFEWSIDNPESFWGRYKHEFDPVFGRNVFKEEPTLELLFDNESEDAPDATDWENGISLNLSNRDDLEKFAEIVDGEVRDDLCYPIYQSTECPGVELQNGIQVILPPEHSDDESMYIETPGWTMSAEVDTTTVTNMADDDFFIQGDDFTFEFVTERTREELGYYDD